MPLKELSTTVQWVHIIKTRDRPSGLSLLGENKSIEYSSQKGLLDSPISRVNLGKGLICLSYVKQVIRIDSSAQVNFARFKHYGGTSRKTGCY